MPFHALGLKDELVQGIIASGYSVPTEIQAKAIPIAVSGKDLIGCAQTGTGKTAAFVLPLLQKLSEYPPTTGSQKRAVKALVLTPTRELAVQVESFLKQYGSFLPLKSVCVYGGVSISPQINALHRGVDVVIATPGRLLDHIDRKTVNLSKVEMLVLDEADRMLDMGFINDVRTIIKLMPAERQTLLFSATMPREVRELANSVMHSPKSIEIGPHSTPIASVTQYFYSIEKSQKLELLLHILRTQEIDNVLVFSRTKHGADKITRRLEREAIKAVAIHSNRTQAQRQRALDGFRNGQYKVLVATDIAARGIDVEGISHVINFDTPTHPEDYIHRIGRTGRASATGDALTFVSSEEESHMRDIERFISKRFERKKYEGFTFVATPPSAAPARREESADDRPPRQDRGPSQGSRGPRRAPQGRDGGRDFNRDRPAPRPRTDRDRPPRERMERAPRPEGPRDANRANVSERSFAPQRGGDRRGPAGPRNEPRRSGRPSSGPSRGGPQRSGRPTDPRGRSRNPQHAGQSGGRSPFGDRFNREGSNPAPAQGQDHSSLRLYSKTKPVKKNVAVSKFTGALFNHDEEFVHPLDKNKKKKFSWNPFSKKK